VVKESVSLLVKYLRSYLNF